MEVFKYYFQQFHGCLQTEDSDTRYDMASQLITKKLGVTLVVSEANII